MATTIEELLRMIDQLSPQDQERVLAYTHELAAAQHLPHTMLPPGTPGHMIANLRVSPEGGAAMEQALDDCERIDEDEW
jgi:hypothetical protein